jgi:hypothetical protein
MVRLRWIPPQLALGIVTHNMIAHTATAVRVLGYGSRQDGGLLQLQLNIENASGEKAHLR